jgi:hypothetical protein
MMNLLDRNNVPTEWLLNLPVHCNHKVNKIYADDLFERMVRGNVLTGEVKNGERTMLSRAQAGGRAISASLARNAAAEGDRETPLANIP